MLNCLQYVLLPLQQVILFLLLINRTYAHCCLIITLRILCTVLPHVLPVDCVIAVEQFGFTLHIHACTIFLFCFSLHYLHKHSHVPSSAIREGDSIDSSTCSSNSLPGAVWEQSLSDYLAPHRYLFTHCTQLLITAHMAPLHTIIYRVIL